MKTCDKAIKWLSGAHFVVDSYSGFLNPILPFIAANLGISMAVAALMVSASNLTASFSQPLFGFIADKWKKRFFIFWGIIFASVFLSLIGIAPNPWILALCIIFGSMGVSFFHPQSTSFVAFFSSEKNAGKDMSIYIAMGTIGYAVGPLISSSITDTFGLHTLPVASVIGILLAFSMFLFVPKVSLMKTEVVKSSLLTAFKDMFANKTMRILLMTSILKSLIVSSYCLILPFYWKSLNYPASKIGIILFLFLIFGGIGTYASPFIENRFGAKKVFYLSMMLVFPLALLFYVFQYDFHFIAVGAFFILGFVSFLSVPLNMLMAQRTMPQYNSMISGFIGGFSWGVIGLLLPFITFIAQKAGIMNILLAISVIPLCLAYFVKYLPEKY